MSDLRLKIEAMSEEINELLEERAELLDKNEVLVEERDQLHAENERLKAELEHETKCAESYHKKWIVSLNEVDRLREALEEIAEAYANNEPISAQWAKEALAQKEVQS